MRRARHHPRRPAARVATPGRGRARGPGSPGRRPGAGGRVRRERRRSRGRRTPDHPPAAARATRPPGRARFDRRPPVRPRRRGCHGYAPAGPALAPPPAGVLDRRPRRREPPGRREAGAPPDPGRPGRRDPPDRRLRLLHPRQLGGVGRPLSRPPERRVEAARDRRNGARRVRHARPPPPGRRLADWLVSAPPCPPRTSTACARRSTR